MTDRVTTLADLQHDPENARIHDVRNLSVIQKSLEEVGAWRSIGIDEDDTVFMGNGVIEAAKQAGISKVRVVEASGDEIIAVRRRGLTAEQKRFAALADNRASDLSSFDPSRIAALAEQGTDMTALFDVGELAAILERAGDTILGNPPGLSDESFPTPLPPPEMTGIGEMAIRVIVLFENEEEHAAFAEMFGVPDDTSKILYHWADLQHGD